jgi:hypothetical protein
MKTFKYILRRYLSIFAWFFTADAIFHDIGSKIDTEISPGKKFDPYSAGLLAVAIFLIADLIWLLKKNKKSIKQNM